MPMTDALLAAVGDESQSRHPGFWRLPAGFDQLLAEWSKAGPVAYVEAEYFGGVGEQNAAVWRDGKMVLGPLHLLEGETVPAAGTPACQALRELGVSARGKQVHSCWNNYQLATRSFGIWRKRLETRTLERQRWTRSRRPPSSSASKDK
uniref:hypothetical protein n=1 Tax=Streptomyces sp. NBC_01001 TaxID=2903713 RepID=UPI003BAD2DF7